MMYGYDDSRWSGTRWDFLMKSRRWKRELRKIRKLKTELERYAADSGQLQAGPIVAEALALLRDDNLVWSEDFLRVRHLLADLLEAAGMHPTMCEIAEQLAEQLVYGGDDLIGELGIK
jgi:hypothetical protein